MSQSHALQAHIGQLEEIRAIMNAMKNLAFMEIHKLSHYQSMQGQAAARIEEAAIDLLNFYPELIPKEEYDRHLCILVGSERGFCGDFNESLMAAVSLGDDVNLIVVGNRLGNKLLESGYVIMKQIAGANVAEEVPWVINQLVDCINSHAETNNLIILGTAAIKLTVIYHDGETNRAKARPLFPPFPQQQRRPPQYDYPPALNLNPGEFYADLIHHYLFAVLHEVFYRSFTAENHKRLEHLDGAINHLDDETTNLRRKLQTYRQEEITEEIEVILLNSENT